MSLLVRFADDEHEVRTVTALDELLDRVALDRQPLLVELVGDAASMHLGVGLDRAAVLLFRDAEGNPWCGRGHTGPPIATEERLTFSKDGTSFQFFADAAVHPSDMRAAAHEFFQKPNERPAAVAWLPEGGDTASAVIRQDGAEGDDGGS